MAGILRVEVETPTGSFVGSQCYSDVSMGSTFGFEAGSSLLSQDNPTNWSCGSAGVLGGTVGAAVFIRKHETEGKFKIDFLDIEQRGGRQYHPRRNPHQYGYEDKHHQSLETWKVNVVWSENGTETHIDFKEL